LNVRIRDFISKSKIYKKRDEIERAFDELGISALEDNTKIAGTTIISDSGNIIYQTQNWDLTNQINIIFNVIKGDSSFVLNNLEFKIVENTPKGIIGTNDNGIKDVIFAPFQGGMFVSYTIAQADPPNALTFPKTFAMRLNRKV